MDKIRIGISACLLGENVCSGMAAVNDDHARAETILLTNKAILLILPPPKQVMGAPGKVWRNRPVRLRSGASNFFQEVL